MCCCGAFACCRHALCALLRCPVLSPSLCRCRLRETRVFCKTATSGAGGATLLRERSIREETFEALRARCERARVIRGSLLCMCAACAALTLLFRRRPLQRRARHGGTVPGCGDGVPGAAGGGRARRSHVRAAGHSGITHRGPSQTAGCPGRTAEVRPSQQKPRAPPLLAYSSGMARRRGRQCDVEAERLQLPALRDILACWFHRNQRTSAHGT
jgi:hypothetical protein